VFTLFCYHVERHGAKKEGTKKMKNEKDIFVSEIRQHVSLNAGHTTPRPKHFKRSKILGRISPVGLALLCIGIGASMLAGLLTDVFFAQTQGEIELNGNTVIPLFFYDEEPFTGRFYNASMDITSIDAGETQTFTHVLRNGDACYWAVAFTGDAVDRFATWRNDPMNEFYGFNVSVTLPDGSPIPALWTFGPTETLSFKITYFLHPEFVICTNLFEFYLNMSITKIDLPPVTTEDEVTIHYNEQILVDVLANDYDPEDDPLTILSFTNPEPATLTMSIVDNKIQIHSLWGSAGADRTATVTITDGVNPPVTENLLIHLVT